MSKQTAINWLIQALESDISVDESNMVTIKMHEHDYITSKNIAFQMEKEQIMKVVIDFGWSKEKAEQYYYNETHE
jgi:hypothetical protein